MIAAIVVKLKVGGSITNVVPFGTEPMPAPPYTVVKAERDPTGKGRRVRVTVHMQPGQGIFLEDYVRDDLSRILSNTKLTSRHGNTGILLDEEEMNEVVTSNDDGTISMERVFLLPSKTF